MSNDLILPKPYAEFRELPKKDGEIQSALRFYKDGPDSFLIQVRAFTSTNYNGTGVRRNMIAHAGISREEAKQLRDSLTAFIGDGV